MFSLAPLVKSSNLIPLISPSQKIKSTTVIKIPFNLSLVFSLFSLFNKVSVCFFKLLNTSIISLSLLVNSVILLSSFVEALSLISSFASSSLVSISSSFLISVSICGWFTSCFSLFSQPVVTMIKPDSMIQMIFL